MSSGKRNGYRAYLDPNPFGDKVGEYKFHARFDNVLVFERHKKMAVFLERVCHITTATNNRNPPMPRFAARTA